jgi:ubiquinone/menaquinone biosynthesis C-methylase UbiE
MSDTQQRGDRLEKVRNQFTRQREAYLAQPDVKDLATLALLAGLSGAGPGDRVLDVACGPGLFTLALAERGAHATGLDATEAFLEGARIEAQRRGVAEIRFLSGDASDLPFEPGEFDLATCRAAFHHFPQPERVLAEMTRVVRPGGKILIADLVAPEDPAQAAVQDEVERLCDPTHASSITGSRFEALFAGCGLRVLQRIDGSLDHDLEQWIAHGGPDPTSADEIRRRMQKWASHDEAALRVRREGERLVFSHRTGVFLLEVPA